MSALTKSNRQIHTAKLRQTSITDESLKLLANAGACLRCIDVAGCKKVTNQGAEALAKFCSQLVDVNVSRCDKISSAGIIALGKACRSLLHLKMAHLYLVKDDAVKVSKVI